MNHLVTAPGTELQQRSDGQQLVISLAEVGVYRQEIPVPAMNKWYIACLCVYSAASMYVHILHCCACWCTTTATVTQAGTTEGGNSKLQLTNVPAHVLYLYIRHLSQFQSWALH